MYLEVTAAFLELSACILFVWFLITHFIKKDSKLPPGPINLPIIGSLHRLGSLPHISFHELSKRYGDLLYLKLGSVPTVVVSSQKAAQEIYRLYTLQLASKFPLIAGEYFGNNTKGLIFSHYTPEVKLLRKLINTHLLSASKLRVFEGIRKEENEQLVQWLRDEQGKPVLLRQKFYESSLNIITYMLFGKRFYGRYKSTEDAHFDQFIDDIVETLRLSGVVNISDYIPALRWLDLQGLEKQYKQLIRKLNSHLMSMLQERRDNTPSFSSNEPMPFIDVLLSMDSTDQRLDDIAKISILFDMLLGGVDTSSVALEWTMAELFKNPNEFLKAREEIDAVVGTGRLVQDSDLPKLKYVEAITKEAMRIHPIAPLPIPKVLQGGPVELNGYTIPDGTSVFLNVYSVAIDEGYWKEPLRFRPQRFMESDVDIFGQNFNLLPFGTGRRVCPGSKLGFDAVHIGVAMLVQAFDWDVEGALDPADMNMDASSGLILHKTQPLVAIPTPRLQYLL